MECVDSGHRGVILPMEVSALGQSVCGCAILDATVIIYPGRWQVCSPYPPLAESDFFVDSLLAESETFGVCFR